MSFLLSPRPDTAPDKTQPVTWQLHDWFGLAFPFGGPAEAFLRTTNENELATGLFPHIATGEISPTQWALYTATCFIGQVANGGLEGFVGNCPGLVLDVARFLEAQDAKQLAEAYNRATAREQDLLRQCAAGDLPVETLLEQLDEEAPESGDEEDLYEELETWVFASDDEGNPVNALAAKVVAQVEANPDELFA